MIPAAPVRLAMSMSCIAMLMGWMIGNVLDPLGGSLHLDWLAISIALAACISIERWRRDRLVLKTWSIPLGVFLFLYVGRWVLDVRDPAAVKAATVATSGGILLFLGMGSMTAIAIGSALEASRSSPRMMRVGAACWASMLLATITILIIQCWMVRQRAQSDLAWINLGGAYQRPGNLLIMVGASFAYGTFAFFRACRISCRLVTAVMMFAMPVLCIATVVLAQLLGSNIAVVILLGLAILTPASMIAGPLWAYRASIMQSANRIVFGLCGAIIAIGSLSAVALLALSIDPSALRITGFGSGRIRSVESRIELWNNFSVHFADSPLLGNMAVDVETTGRGSYVHSLVGMLLTHTGIVGFVLFATAVALAVRSLLRQPVRPPELEAAGRGRPESIFMAAMLVAFLVVASLGTAISWAPVWFVLGLAATPIMFEPKQVRRLEQNLSAVVS